MTRPRPARFRASQERRGLRHRSRQVVTTRHEDGDVDVLGTDFVPGEPARAGTGRREDRLASRRLDLVGHPVPGVEGGSDHSEHEDPRPSRAPLTRRRTAPTWTRRCSISASASAVRARRITNRPDAPAITSSSRAEVEETTCA